MSHSCSRTEVKKRSGINHSEKTKCVHEAEDKTGSYHACHDYMIACRRRLPAHNVAGDKITIYSFARLQRLRRNIEPSIGSYLEIVSTTTEYRTFYAGAYRVAPILYFVQLSSN